MAPPASYPDLTQVAEAFEAARAGRVNELQRILYLRPSAFHEATDPHGGGGGLLHAGVGSGNPSVVDYLLSKQFPVDRFDAAGRTLLHLNPAPTVTAAILDRAGTAAHALIAAQDFACDLPAHVMARSGNAQGVLVLIRHSKATAAMLARADRQGNTVIHELARSCPMLLVQLMADGIDVRARNDAGDTPEDLCTAPKIKAMLSAQAALLDRSDATRRERYIADAKAAIAAKAAARARTLVAESASVAQITKKP